MERRTPAAWWLGGWAVFAVCGCNFNSCPDVGCATSVRLKATRPAPAELSTLDVMSCRGDDDCQEASVDLADGTGQTCKYVSFALSVCVNRSGDLLKFEAVWTPMAPPIAEPYRLLLTDHSTGEVLLDQTRTITAKESLSDDGCTRCSSAEKEL
jgi:hypothetical protein